VSFDASGAQIFHIPVVSGTHIPKISQRCLRTSEPSPTIYFDLMLTKN
jgi:hypothetical protein